MRSVIIGLLPPVFYTLALEISVMAGDFYKLTATALNGEEVKFSKYKGKVVLIQNTASL